MHTLARAASYIIDTSIRLLAGISMAMWLRIIVIAALIAVSQGWVLR